MQDEQYALFLRLSGAVQDAMYAQNMTMAQMMPVLVNLARNYHDRRAPVPERVIVVPYQVAVKMPHLFGDDFMCVRDCANMAEGDEESPNWVMMPFK